MIVALLGARPVERIHARASQRNIGSSWKPTHMRSAAAGRRDEHGGGETGDDEQAGEKRTSDLLGRVGMRAR